VLVLYELDVDPDLAVRKAAQVAEKVRASLAEPYQLNAHERYSSPSIGVCMYLGNEVGGQDLIKNADVAMYQAKDDGRNVVRFFDLAMQNTVETRALLDAELRHCVRDQQLLLFYQIQVDQQHRPFGAEALVRWLHPRRGMVAPTEFIGIAEESSMIIEIGNWVLDTACKQLYQWSLEAKMRDLTLAVNVSAQQFKQSQFVELVSAALQRHGSNPKRLKLELTESVVLSDVEDVISKMHALNTLEVGLSLDDFGTGYSSLSYLKRLPLDQIKIDQSFVRDIENDVNDAVMVRSIIDLANNFGMRVIAEGVETRKQLDFLKKNGCHEFQGYYFGKPLPIDEFEALLGRIGVESADIVA
jgi:EAL domain-containing protein (putative c-di-GMP-specific phosphodiesterase class I)